MSREVRLLIGDVVLEKALRVMLKELNIESTNVENAVTLTDNTEFADKKGRTVYIVREGEGRRFLKRPITKEGLIQALEVFFTDKADKKQASLVLDKKRDTAVLYGEKIPLTDVEMRLLSLLYENRGKTVSDAEILARVWKNETANGSNIVAVYVKYLRRKLDERVGKRLIFRVRGEGYLLRINEKE